MKRFLVLFHMCSQLVHLRISITSPKAAKYSCKRLTEDKRGIGYGEQGFKHTNVEQRERQRQQNIARK